MRAAQPKNRHVLPLAPKHFQAFLINTQKAIAAPNYFPPFRGHRDYPLLHVFLTPKPFRSRMRQHPDFPVLPRDKPVPRRGLTPTLVHSSLHGYVTFAASGLSPALGHFSGAKLMKPLSVSQSSHLFSI